METLVTLVAFIILIRGVITLFTLFSSLTWLKRNCLSSKESEPNTIHPNVYILIPALREQKNIIETVKYLYKHFAAPNVKFVVVTTQREFEIPFDGASTNTLVTNYIRQERIAHSVSCVDYPKKKGNMASQLNFVVKNIEDDNAFIVVYNADSRPATNTLTNFYHLLSRHPEAKVFQQSATFLKNFTNLNIFLKTQAIWQTRWTLAHEMPRLIRQSSSKSQAIRTYANVNCVGHGLFIKLAELKKIGLFSEKMMNEDTFLAYLLRSRGLNIYPIPGLELSDSPTTIKSLWKQKYVWYWGPMQYPKYLLYVLKNCKDLGIRNMYIPIILFIQGMISATAWIISAPLVLLLLLSPIFVDGWLVSLSYTALVVYGPLQAAIVYLYSPLIIKNSESQKFTKESLLTFLGVISLCIPAVIFHGIPPYFSLFNELKHSLTGKEVYKPKTEN